MYKIAFEPAQFIKSLTKAGLKAASRKWDEVPEQFAEAFGIEHNQDEPSRKAAQLISRAMGATLRRVLRTPVNHLRAEVNDEAKLVKKIHEGGQRLVKNLSAVDKPEFVEIEPTAFSDPAKLPRLEACRSRVYDWLIQCGYPDGEAKKVANKMHDVFADELLGELRAHIKDYGLLLQFADTKLTVAGQHLEAWRKYTAEFENEREKNGFLVEFPTHRLFIWPRAYHIERPTDTSAERGPREMPYSREVRHVVDLKAELTRWWEAFPTAAADKKRLAAFRVVGGDPGGGKSTTTREFAHLRASEHYDRVLYCPIFKLRNFQWGKFEEELGKFFKNETGHDLDPVATASAARPLLLILDGLDELSAHGEKGRRAADQFVTEVIDAVHGWNNLEPRVAVLFSGRPIPTQEVAHHFREPGQVLHLLPYIVPNYKEYDDPCSLLSVAIGDQRTPVDQRPVWWQKYGEATDKYQPMPEMFDAKDVIDITSQPMMHHLAAVVSADPNVAKTLCPDGRFSRPSLFGQILKRVHTSAWRESKRPPLELPEYTSLLSVLGQAAWHGGTGRVTTQSDFQRLCREANIEQLLEKHAKEVADGPLGFFTTFYVRYSTPDTSGPIEFTHKAFAEYLTAIRLADLAEELTARLDQPKDPRHRYGAKWTATELLADWLSGTGPAPLTAELFDLLCEEMKQRHAQDKSNKLVPDVRNAFILLMNANLQSGMPAHELHELQFLEMADQAANSEHALVCMLGACVLATRDLEGRTAPPTHPGLHSGRRSLVNPSEVTEWQTKYERWAQAQEWLIRIAWPTSTASADLIRRIRKPVEFSLERSDPLPLVDFDLHEQQLDFSNLNGSLLSGAVLSGAQLNLAFLHRADLISADLSGASMYGAYLASAKLSKACLEGVGLTQASLQCAELDGAILDRAELDGAKLLDVSLREATHGDVKLDTDAGRRLLTELGARISRQQSHAPLSKPTG